MKDQKPIIIPGPELSGLWDRGSSGANVIYPGNTCPVNGFTGSNQVRYFPWGCKTRQGYTNTTTNAAWTTIRQVVAYSTNRTDQGVLNAPIRGYLVVSGNDIFDSNSPTPGTAIYLGGGNTYYISIITLFGRIYITPHDFNTSFGATFIVYRPGTGVVARNVAGTPTALGAATFVSSATVGFVTTGLHIFGVTFETNTGHIMGISSANVGAFTIAGTNKSVDGATIPLGPASTVKRHILASRKVTGYSGDPTDYELFYVAEINDNVTTTITFNFTDESLVDSADSLYSVQSVPNAGLGFCWFGERLITWGETWTNFNNLGPSYLRVSDKGFPESFSDTTGFVSVYPDDGQYGVKVCFEQDGLLVICKEDKTYVTRDNGGDPNTWEVAAIDLSQGSVLYGVNRSLDTTGSAKSGKTVVANRNGISLFQGQFLERPLTWKIESLWKRVVAANNGTVYPRIQIIDIAQAKIFVVAVTEGNFANPTKLLAADYSNGLDWQNIKWSNWNVLNVSNFISLYDYKTLLFVSGGNEIWSMSIGSPSTDYNASSDNSNPIANCEIITTELNFDDILSRDHILQARLRGFAGLNNESPSTLALAMGDDNFITVPPFSPNLASSEIIKSNVNSGGFYDRLKITWTGQEFEMRQLVIFGKAEDKDIPSGSLVQ